MVRGRRRMSPHRREGEGTGRVRGPGAAGVPGRGLPVQCLEGSLMTKQKPSGWVLRGWMPDGCDVVSAKWRKVRGHFGKSGVRGGLDTGPGWSSG